MEETPKLHEMRKRLVRNGKRLKRNGKTNIRQASIPSRKIMPPDAPSLPNLPSRGIPHPTDMTAHKAAGLLMKVAMKGTSDPKGKQFLKGSGVKGKGKGKRVSKTTGQAIVGAKYSGGPKK